MTNWQAFAPYDSTEALKHATRSDPWSTAWLHSSGYQAGFGPYTVTSNQPGKETVYEAFADYHGPQPKLKTVITQEVDSPSTRAAVLTSGAVDLATNLLRSDYSTLQQTSGVTVDNFRTGRSSLLFGMLNLLKPPFNDPLVRQALAYATPYSQIVTNVYGDFASEWPGIISQDYPLFDAGAWPYGKGGDIDRARSLLKKAGLAKATIPLIYNDSDPTWQQVAIQLQTAFQPLNITLQLQGYASAEFTQLLTARQFTMAIWEDHAITPDIGYACDLYYKSDGFSNFGSYRSAVADGLIAQLLITLKTSAREAPARALQRVVVNDSPMLFIAQPHLLVARRSSVGGITEDPSQSPPFSYMTKT